MVTLYRVTRLGMTAALEVASTSALILSKSDMNIPRGESAWKIARIRAMFNVLPHCIHSHVESNMVVAL